MNHVTPPTLAAQLVEQLSTEQKAALTTGASFWRTADLAEFGLPPIMMADGPHGLRKQDTGGDHLGMIEGAPATCFPPAVGLASTWNTELISSVGSAIALEAKAAQVSVVLGPGVNIKRSVRCGRNFEYFSEDPLLSGQLGADWVYGAQSTGVGTSLKHFAANNQETERLRNSSELDERTLHEIYLKAFRHIVTTEKPWTVMCAYNAINGVFAAENRWLLTELLRDDWGFDGLVVSDWGAVHDRVEAIRAGLDLEMPSSHGRTAAEVVAAHTAGTLDPDELDRAAERVAALVLRSVAELDDDAVYDEAAHHELAREAAAAGIVLLKNDNSVLPLTSAPGNAIAIVGELARTPRYQGSGSSLIVPTRLDDALSAITDRLPSDSVSFTPGYRLDSVEDAELARASVEATRAATVAIVFLGLPPQDESEGYDREHIELPAVQTALLEQLIATETEIVVVLSNGSAVRVSGWADRVSGLIEGWLLGQGGGEAIARVLLGEVNPSGRLAETIPVRIQDTPDFLDFPGEDLKVRYGEGVFVGYRWYDAREIPVSFPFGFGLSYTRFSYSEVTAEVRDGSLHVQLRVRNDGDRDGRETVQVYTGLSETAILRPRRELRGFAQVEVPAGQTVPVLVTIPLEELNHYSVADHGWRREGGAYTVSVGSSSRDLHAEISLHIAGAGAIRPLTVDSSVGEWLAHPAVSEMVREVIVKLGIEPGGYRFRMAQQLPIRGAVTFANGLLVLDELERAAATTHDYVDSVQ